MRIFEKSSDIIRFINSIADTSAFELLTKTSCKGYMNELS